MFPNKRKVDIKEAPVRFNGVELAVVDGGDKIIMHQPESISKIEKIRIQKDMIFDQFQSLCAQFSYAGFSTVQHVLIFVSFSTTN